MNKKLFKKLVYIFGKLIPDKLFLSIRYYIVFGKKINWKSPKTYNEKLQWMKLYLRKPIMTEMVDKYDVRQYIKDRIGEEYLIPILGVWENVEDIDFTELPEQFVMKCTHDSGSVVVCKDKTKLDYDAIKNHFTRCLKKTQFVGGREWPYKNVKPKIIAEKLMVDESGTELKDYKFLCFNGEPKLFFVATDRGRNDTDVKFDFFDTQFNHMPFKHGHEWADKPINKPENFDAMLDIARKLSSNWPHLRVDLYNINGKIYFGELTFFHHCGFVPFTPDEWDRTLGDWITLPEINK